ncbi:hypothetical protein NFK05_19040 [Klebsiella michiganensis]|uniref:hypothetical protein n=1 Tax=Klebsiella michiganensis TaxID=1134687 RepID=UPI001E290049|nr:hypothetical protein [Klebsiella michiganensis]WFX45901.1 hypothetical protein NFK05_19040 [Klebsiella michiganensis]WFX51565.1 hypothetical protein NFK06_19035 [Klebsiella michiganensis]
MTSKLTREQTQQIIDAADAVITALAGTNDEVHRDDTDKMVRLWDDLNDRYAPPEIVRELARIALAAMDSEPVAEVCEDYAIRYISSGPAPKEGLHPGDKLYRHAQQPVVPDYPETLPCPVLLEPGLRFGKGVKTRLVLDAIQRRAEHSAELEAMTPEERAEYDAGIEAFKAMLPQPVPDNSAITQHFDTIALETARGIMCDVNRRQEFLGGEIQLLSRIQCRIDDACRAAMLQGAENTESRCGIQTAPALDSLPKNAESRCGNSPVIPEGYVMVPKEPTKEMIDAGWLHYMGTKNPSSKGTYKAMLAAAPQEVKGE